MPQEKTELLKGTLDMLILKVVAAGPIHGYQYEHSYSYNWEAMRGYPNGKTPPPAGKRSFTR